MKPSIFSIYDLSETELKNKIIISSAEFLVKSPKLEIGNFNVNIASLDDDSFIKEIFKHMPLPAFKDIIDGDLTYKEKLMLIAINLDSFNNQLDLSKALHIRWEMLSVTQLLGKEYSYIANVIRKELGGGSNNNIEEIVEVLAVPPLYNMNVELFKTAKLAEEEMSQLESHPEMAQQCYKIMSDFTLGIEQDTGSIIHERLDILFMRIMVEMIDKHSKKLYTKVGIPDEYYKKISKNIRKGIESNEKQLIKDGFTDLRGGNQYKSGISWSDHQNKIDFYLKVESLPVKDKKSIWTYAFEEYKNKDFNWKIKDYLKENTDLKQAPQELVEEAFDRWKNYRNRRLKKSSEDHPWAFQLRHALQLLSGYPEGNYRSLKRYYGEGKKLFKDNDLNDANSKL